MAAKKAAKKSAKRSAAKSTGRSAGRSAQGSSKKVAAKSPARRAGAVKAGSRKGAVQPIPSGYYTATPYLILSNAARAIDFYKRAFGATELMRFGGPDGRVGHAELKIGNSVIMMADETDDHMFKSPQTLGGTSGSIMLYVPDVDRVFAQAIRAGAKEVRPVINQFYGDRSGFLEDPFGHQWAISTHVEDVSPEEMARRMSTMQPPSGG